MSATGLPTDCPNCKRPLVDNSKGHCLDRRRKPCGWVVCKSCQTILDRFGNHYPRKEATG